MGIRALDLTLLAPASRARAMCCEEPGCDKSTRKGKPYCSDHVERLPYVRQLLTDLEEREQAPSVHEPGDLPEPVGSAPAA